MRDREHILLSMDHSGSEQESGAEMSCVNREDGELTPSDCLLGAEPCARHRCTQSHTWGSIIPILQQMKIRLR